MKYVLVLASLCACGTEPAATTAAPASTVATPATVDTPAVAAPDLTLYTVALATGLPPCDAVQRGRILYIAATKEFKYCEEDQTWYDIDIKGEAGKGGAQGIPGARGADGTDGVDGARGDVGASGSAGSQGMAGVPGVAGVAGPRGDKGDAGVAGDNGVDGKSASGADWYDQVSKHWWTTEHLSQEALTTAQDVCSGTYKLPSPTQYRVARLRGIPTLGNVWADDGSVIKVDGTVDAVAVVAFIYCVEAP